MRLSFGSETFISFVFTKDSLEQQFAVRMYEGMLWGRHRRS